MRAGAKADHHVLDPTDAIALLVDERSPDDLGKLDDVRGHGVAPVLWAVLFQHRHQGKPTCTSLQGKREGRWVNPRPN